MTTDTLEENPAFAAEALKRRMDELKAMVEEISQWLETRKTQLREAQLHQKMVRSISDSSGATHRSARRRS